MNIFFKARVISYKNLTRWGICGVIGTLAFPFGMIGVVPQLIEAVRPPIPDALLLKAEPGDILASKVITVINNDGREEIATLYGYRSDKKVDSTPSYRVLNRASNEGFTEGDEILPKRTRNSRTFSTSVPGTYITEIIASSPQYHKDNAGVWWQVEFATTTPEAFERQLGRKGANIAYAASNDFFPDADPETTTVDGIVFGRGSNWAEARGDADGWQVFDDLAFNNHGPAIAGSVSGDSIVSRFVAGFDTSSLGSTTIISAEFTVTAVAVEDDYGGSQGYINAVRPAPASNTALAPTDFPNFTGLPGAMAKGSDDDKDLTLMATGPNTWVLNATGQGWINGNGITWLGLAEGHDIEDVPVNLIDNTENRMQVAMAETAGTESDPKLTVVHTGVDVGFVWPVAPANLSRGHDGPCGEDWPDDPKGCFWLSNNSEDVEKIWRDVQPFQRHELVDDKTGKVIGYHLGADYNLGGGDSDLNKPVYPTANGTVRKVLENVCGWGNIIFVRHDTSMGVYTSMYAHVNWLDKGKPKVKVQVSPLEPIAQIGKGSWNRTDCPKGKNKGSYPAHLHFELRKGNNTTPGPAYTKEKLKNGENGQGHQGQINPNAFIATH